MVLKDQRSKEFFSGLGSAIISITLVYPATKVIYRQILENASFRDSMLKMKTEGFRYLYRGMGPPMLQRCTELSLMFGVYKSAETALQHYHICHYRIKLYSSAIAGVVEALFTPFERIQMLLIDSTKHHQFRNMVHAAVVIGNQYGVKEYYRGFNLVVLRNVCHNVFFFTAKDGIYKITERQHLPTGFDDFIVGSIIGTFMTTLFYPMKVLKVQIQQQLGGGFQTMLYATKVIYARDRRGLRNFYRGLNPNIIRSFFSWGITNLSYEFFRTHI